MIALKDCIDGGLYRLDSRNLDCGVFNADTSGFIGIRTKMGLKYLFKEYHIEIEQYGTAEPLELIDVTEFKNPSEANELLFLFLKERCETMNPIDEYENILIKYADIVDMVKEYEEKAKEYVKGLGRTMRSSKGVVTFSFIPSTTIKSIRSKDLLMDIETNELLGNMVAPYISSSLRNESVRVSVSNKNLARIKDSGK